MAYELNNPETSRIGDPSAVDDDLSKISPHAATVASDLGRKASQKAEQVRMAAAGGLDSAAQAVHERADRVAAAAHNTADALASSAGYVRDNGVWRMTKDLMGVVKNNPAPALLGAAALGFLVGRALSHD